MSTAPTFSLLYTTARPALAAEVIAAWREKAGISSSMFDQMIEFVLTVDKGNEAVLDELRSKYPKLVTGVNTGPKTCVAGWNLAAKLSTGKILISVSDDFVPPAGWYMSLRKVGPPNLIDCEVVIAVSDGCNPDIFTISILTRKRYERFGYLFYPGYSSLFCDTEFSCVAIADEVVIDARHLLFEHKHYSARKRQKDEVDELHASQARWARGETLFNFRRSAGFPIDAGPVAEARFANPLRLGVVVQAIKDDFCLYEVVDRLLSEPLDGTFEIACVSVFHPNKYWSGELTKPEETEEVKAVCKRLFDKYGNKIQFVPFEVDRVSHFKQSRIRTETDCRNWYQHTLNKNGIEHALIMDGDELWKPGLLKKVCDYVREVGPNSVFTGMIPVIGLPGYPVQDARDKATVYCRTDIRFKECRGAFGLRHELPAYDIYHFTATRRTMDEIVKKHRDSGHNDDKDYDFEGWIKNTLLAGRIVPGARDLHMYVKGQNVWPVARNWTEQELRRIPQSLHKYLGNPLP